LKSRQVLRRGTGGGGSVLNASPLEVWEMTGISEKKREQIKREKFGEGDFLGKTESPAARVVRRKENRAFN